MATRIYRFRDDTTGQVFGAEGRTSDHALLNAMRCRFTSFGVPTQQQLIQLARDGDIYQLEFDPPEGEPGQEPPDGEPGQEPPDGECETVETPSLPEPEPEPEPEPDPASHFPEIFEPPTERLTLSSPDDQWPFETNAVDAQKASRRRGAGHVAGGQ